MPKTQADFQKFIYCGQIAEKKLREISPSESNRRIAPYERPKRVANLKTYENPVPVQKAPQSGTKRLPPEPNRQGKSYDARPVPSKPTNVPIPVFDDQESDLDAALLGMDIDALIAEKHVAKKDDGQKLRATIEQ